jgi:oxaloacetate decarboxylase alpha subunit
MARHIEDAGADSICIKDMAGLLKPYIGYELVSELKKAVDIPIQLHAHATTGLSTATITKCVEAGIDNVDTSISSMSMTYGHSATESVVSIFQEHDRDTGLDIVKIEEIATYFRKVRRKYSVFEGSLKGIDPRILVAQVPGGMLTNMENQLREQGCEDKLDAVLTEIPKVRKDLGYIPLVTPTSQIVGTQSVINVIMGERYKTIAEETAKVLRGEYGKTPAPVNAELQKQVLDPGETPITCRPADNLLPEIDNLTKEFDNLVESRNLKVVATDNAIDDLLTYALFPQVGLKFLENRDNPAAFEPIPDGKTKSAPTTETGEKILTVQFENKTHVVTVNEGGDITGMVSLAQSSEPIIDTTQTTATGAEPVTAPLAGNVIQLSVSTGQKVAVGDTLLIMEAMKMETNISAAKDGVVSEINVRAGDTVAVGDILLTIQ